MGSLAGGGKWSLWGMGPFDFQEFSNNRRSRRRSNRESKPSNSVDANSGAGSQFPVKQALTAASLALTGDTIAQFQQRWVKNIGTLSNCHDTKDVIETLFSEHDWLRALRMTSYGFLLYGPGSYAWYQFLERVMPKQTVENLLIKVLLNQIVLGPMVIAVVFAWNNLWQGRLSELPNKYRKDALPTLFFGFRFWIPVSILNFWVVPLQARVAFMSMGSIFWNFFLSSTMIKGNQNFIAPENWRSRQDYGEYPVARRNTWNNLHTISPLLPGAGPLNPREVLLEPWRLFQVRATSGPLGMASFPGQRYYPDQMIHIDNDEARNTYQRQRRSSPEPSPSFQGGWNIQPAPEEESRLTQDEQKQVLNKLKKEVYFPTPKRGRRPNLYFREYSINSLVENGKENNEDGKRCAICLDDFEPREVVTVTPCKHMFHEDCIIPWVKSQGQCPVCRYAICERFRETAASSNNLLTDEVDLISIIRAMEEAFLSENMRRIH